MPLMFSAQVLFKKWKSFHRRQSCSMKKLFLRISQYSQGKAVLESPFNSEYYEIFKSTYFEEHLWTAASENVLLKLKKIWNCW